MPNKPWILCVDTTTSFCSLSLHGDKDYIFHEEGGNKQSSMMVPMVMELINKAQINFHDINKIVVNVGPGSFTGIRLGLSFVNACMVETDIRAIGVDTFDIIFNKYRSEILQDCSILIPDGIGGSYEKHYVFPFDKINHEITHTKTIVESPTLLIDSSKAAEHQASDLLPFGIDEKLRMYHLPIKALYVAAPKISTKNVK